MIKFGCCLPGGSFMPEGVSSVGTSVWERVVTGCRYMAEIGYDYAELTAGLLNGLTIDECRRAASEGIRVLAVNSILPHKLSGENRTESSVLAEYLDGLCARTAAIGAEYLVFGSGAARRCPDGYAMEENFRDVENFLRIINEKPARTVCGW